MSLILTLLLAFVQLPAEQATPQPPKPYVGQPGKDVVWVPSPPETTEAMLDLAEVTAQDLVVDLGSGDGRNVIAAAKRGARALGVEYNPDLVALSRATAESEGVADRARFVQGDMYEADFSEATVLALFLLPENLRKLLPKFLELKPGTRIVANTFGIEGWEPDARKRVEGECTAWCEAMLYIVPAKVGGTWELEQGTLTLTQEFQKVSGTFDTGERTLRVENGRLRGSQIELTIDGVVYTGTVNGDSMEGEAKGGNGQRFVARRRAPA